MPDENQCDGCKAGIPVDENGNHRMGSGSYPDLMSCQKDEYVKPPCLICERILPEEARYCEIADCPHR